MICPSNTHKCAGPSLINLCYGYNQNLVVNHGDFNGGNPPMRLGKVRYPTSSLVVTGIKGDDVNNHFSAQWGGIGIWHGKRAIAGMAAGNVMNLKAIAVDFKLWGGNTTAYYGQMANRLPWNGKQLANPNPVLQ